MSQPQQVQPPHQAEPPALGRPPAAGRAKAYAQGLTALLAVYLFIAAINLMGHGLKTVAKVPQSKAHLDKAFALAEHPLAGLCVGVLITSLVQSSSFTTSFTVGLVAAGQMSLATAIPIVMGANIGTSVTNTLVSLVHLRRRGEFRRSLGGAIVHDFFNVLAVMVLLPLEVGFGLISRPAKALAGWLGGAAFFTPHPRKFNLVKQAVVPLARGCDALLQGWLGLSKTVAGAATAVLAVALLLVALVILVKMLQGLLRDRLSGLFSRTLFRNGATAFVVGLLTTAAIQSSSVTTSLVVPLVGAGVLTLPQIFPYTLGANIGTTVTAILAALAAAALAASAGPAVQAAAGAGLAVAFGHLLFNVFGTCIFWPAKWIPISLASGFAKRAAKRRLLAAAYILVIFFVLPIVVIVLVNR